MTNINMQKMRTNLVKLDASGPRLEVSSIGAKAFHLQAAMSNGHPVPPAIVLPADLLEGYATPDGALCLDTSFLEDLAATVGEVVPGPWAVRSSGTAEDGDTQSFAGQYKTILDVKDIGGLANAICDCWGSRLSNQVSQYAAGNASRMAVIVQSMVRAEVAGVAFSADPVTGDRSTVAINAVNGLGERLVSGETTPESITVDAKGIHRIGKEPILSEAQVRELVTLVRQVEAEAGCPQDIEWAFQNGKLWLLQARPITSLPPQPLEIPLEVPTGFWQRDDHCPFVTEMGWDTWYKWYGKAMTETFRMFGAPVEEFKFARIQGNIYTQVKIEGDDGKAPPPNFVMWLVVRLLPGFRKAEKIASQAWADQLHRRFITQWDTEWKQEFQTRIKPFDVKGLSSMSTSALLESLERVHALAERGAMVHARLGAANVMTLGEFALFCKRHLGWSTKEALELSGGYSHATTELTALLRDWIKENPEYFSRPDDSDTNASLSQMSGWDAQMSEIIDLHGLRMLNYDLNNPTLGEKPHILEQNLKAMAKNMGQRGEKSSGNDQSTERIQHASAKLKDAGLRQQFLDLVEWMKKGTQVRDENGSDTYARPFGLMRLHLLELGRRIQGLKDPADIFFLNRSELSRSIQSGLGELGAVIDRRKGEYQWAKLNRGPKSYGKDVPPPPSSVFRPGLRHLFDLIGWMDEAERIEDDWMDVNQSGKELVGNGVFAGTYTGIARVVQSPLDFDRVLPGEIMVCRITTGEWSVVFSRVGALVTDEGGMLSHPAIIAREFRLPAVVGTGMATSRIRTGDKITVDGTQGKVFLHDQ